MKHFIYGLTLLSFIAAACSGGSSSDAENSADDTDTRPVVVGTTTIIHDIADNIAGDRMRVLGIMKSGEDPHIYDPRPGDARMLAGGDVVLVNGLHLEGTLHDIVHNNLKPGAVLKELAEDPRIHPIESETYKGAPDPHCWFNVPYVKVYAERTADALAEADPSGAEYYRANLASYLEQLDSLDAYARRVIASIPQERRILVTAHDAFHYFGLEYGIQVMTVIGISTDAEPRPQDMESLISLIEEHNVPAVFIETSVSASLNNMVRKVSEKTGAVVGGTLYSDSLGDPGTPEGTYIGMVRHNLDTIAAALKGEGA